mmetsp:Transcript_21755/g.37085  ORF Transcript_21755/g.37085 Transcript_21755/m.37085 type:complete len:255 (+) Transcript_21755:41-805(+)
MSNIGPALPPNFKKSNEKVENNKIEEKKIIQGPALPPSFKKQEPTKRVAGPSFVPNDEEIQQLKAETKELKPEIEEQQPIVNPYVGPARPSDLGKVKRELTAEEKAAVWKQQITSKQEEEEKGREEWMTSLPALVNPGAKLGNRTFSKSGQIANQDNGWTMAPNERNSLKTQREKQMIDPTEFATLERDKAIAKMMEKYNENHRSKSLVEAHLDKKTKKIEKKKRKREDYDDINSKDNSNEKSKSKRKKRKTFT